MTNWNLLPQVLAQKGLDADTACSTTIGRITRWGNNPIAQPTQQELEQWITEYDPNKKPLDFSLILEKLKEHGVPITAINAGKNPVYSDVVSPEQADLVAYYLQDKEVIRLQRMKEVKQLRHYYSDRGCKWNGYCVQSDPISIGHLLAEAQARDMGLRQDGEYWRMLSNENVSLTNAQFNDMTAAVRFYVQHCLHVSWVHKDTLKTLSSLSEIENYDIYAGWEDDPLTCALTVPFRSGFTTTETFIP